MSLECYTFSMTNLDDEDGAFQCWTYINGNKKIFCRFKDIAVKLGYGRFTRAYDIVPDEYKFKWSELVKEADWITTPPNWQPETLFINEHGLYALLLRSNQPRAKKFMNYVTEEVLPSIRETGAYVSPNIQQSQINNIYAVLKQRETEISEAKATIEKKDQELAKKDELIQSKDNLLQIKEQRLVKTTDEYFTLVHKIVQDRPKLAVMPDRSDVKHELRIYKQKDCYKFIRTQKRNMRKALGRLPPGYEMVLQRKDIPNGINVLNRTKEILPRRDYVARYNEITTQHDLEAIVRDNVLE